MSHGWEKIPKNEFDLLDKRDLWKNLGKFFLECNKVKFYGLILLIHGENFVIDY